MGHKGLGLLSDNIFGRVVRFSDLDSEGTGSKRRSTRGIKIFYLCFVVYKFVRDYGVE